MTPAQLQAALKAEGIALAQRDFGLACYPADPESDILLAAIRQHETRLLIDLMMEDFTRFRAPRIWTPAVAAHVDALPELREGFRRVGKAARAAAAKGDLREVERLLAAWSRQAADVNRIVEGRRGAKR